MGAALAGTAANRTAASSTSPSRTARALHPRALHRRLPATSHPPGTRVSAAASPPGLNAASAFPVERRSQLPSADHRPHHAGIQVDDRAATPLAKPPRHARQRPGVAPVTRRLRRCLAGSLQPARHSGALVIMRRSTLRCTQMDLCGSEGTMGKKTHQTLLVTLALMIAGTASALAAGPLKGKTYEGSAPSSGITSEGHHRVVLRAGRQHRPSRGRQWKVGDGRLLLVPSRPVLHHDENAARSEHEVGVDLRFRDVQGVDHRAVRCRPGRTGHRPGGHRPLLGRLGERNDLHERRGMQRHLLLLREGALAAARLRAGPMFLKVPATGSMGDGRRYLACPHPAGARRGSWERSGGGRGIHPGRRAAPGVSHRDALDQGAQPGGRRRQKRQLVAEA